MSDVTLSKQAAAWKTWKESIEGLRCSKASAAGEYLLNRLWYAFMAGYEAGKEAK